MSDYGLATTNRNFAVEGDMLFLGFRPTTETAIIITYDIGESCESLTGRESLFGGDKVVSNMLEEAFILGLQIKMLKRAIDTENNPNVALRLERTLARKEREYGMPPAMGGIINQIRMHLMIKRGEHAPMWRGPEIG